MIIGFFNISNVLIRLFDTVLHIILQMNSSCKISTRLLSSLSWWNLSSFLYIYVFHFFKFSFRWLVASTERVHIRTKCKWKNNFENFHFERKNWLMGLLRNSKKMLGGQLIILDKIKNAHSLSSSSLRIHQMK